MAIYELMTLNELMRAAIVSDVSEAGLSEAARQSGMRRMIADGIEKVLAGQTTFEEILQVTRVT